MSSEYVDIVIVGAGLSGIGAAYYLQTECPGKRYLILEGRERLGGTWDLFRYPGIRSDSDMHTFGYSFKPWREAKAIADGPSILAYIEETAVEHNILPHIRFNHRVQKAVWSTADAAWTLTVTRRPDADPIHIRCNFLIMGAGYYRYDHGYTPDFAGRDRFRGQIIHPQSWPEGYDAAGQEIVIIGSGATAVTLAPTLAQDAARVTLLQRSPTYIVARPAEDKIANLLRRLLPDRLAYTLTRRKNITLQQFIYRQTRTNPEKVKEKLLDMVRDELGPDFDVETHFTPDYDPWDQRLCLTPDGELFQAIRSGDLAIVTDQIDAFTESGVRLQSGRELPADLIVTATGLDLLLLGGVEFIVDGQPVNFAQTITYKGTMFTGVPNLVTIFGYVNASWTLRADLIAQFTCRLINRMGETGARQCTPRLRAIDRTMQTRPFITDFTPNYMRRIMHLFPRQGDVAPWINPQDYGRDKEHLLHAPLEDGALIFDNPPPPPG